jgi:hypothetical protein
MLKLDLLVQPFTTYRDIQKIDVAPCSPLIPTEHGTDGYCKLHSILLINTTSIYPEISNAIGCSLVGGEVNLLPASLALASASFYILKGDLLLIVGMPSMREYRVGWDFFAHEFVDDEVTVGLALQEAHCETQFQSEITKIPVLRTPVKPECTVFLEPLYQIGLIDRCIDIGYSCETSDKNDKFVSH